MLVKRLFFDEYPFTGMPSGGFDKPVKRKAASIIKQHKHLVILRIIVSDEDRYYCK